MKTPKLTVLQLALIALPGAALTGCQTNTQTGAALGTGLGALTGAIIGHQSGNKETGALLGALAGGAGGALIGNAKDKEEERDTALANAYYHKQARRADQRAVTSREVVELTNQGFSDEYIKRTIQNRGGRFDTSPDAAIYLRRQGVSENVILAMQQYDITR